MEKEKHKDCLKCLIFDKSKFQIILFRKSGGIHYVWNCWFYRRTSGSTDFIGWFVKTGVPGI